MTMSKNRMHTRIGAEFTSQSSWFARERWVSAFQA